MKKMLGIITMIITMLSLSSCVTFNNKEIVKEAEEMEVTKITNTIVDVYNKVSKGCVGIYVTTSSSTGIGSGVIYKYDSENNMYYVVTNAHVIDDATSVKVYLGSNLYIKANVLGYDTKNDVAVVTFQPDIFGGSIVEELYVNDIFNYEENDLVVIGQTVLAIGCPLELENFNSLTTGLISSVDYDKLVIDAALNPGNSGGGLFNMEGRLIGINYKKEVWTSDNTPIEGRSYSIPLDTVKKCINDIEKQNGEIERPLLGLYVASINILFDNETVNKYKEYIPQGYDERYLYLIVESASADESNAIKAGVKPNDVILKANGEDLDSSTELSSILNVLTLSDSILLTVYRKSENKTLDITVTFK